MAEGSPWACTRLGATSWRRGGSAFLLGAAQGGIEAVARRSRWVGTSRFGTSVLNAVPPRRGVARRHAAPARRGADVAGGGSSARRRRRTAPERCFATATMWPRRPRRVTVHGAPQLQLGCSSGSRVAPAPQLRNSGDDSSMRRRWRDGAGARHNSRWTPSPSPRR
jgi:hypothetical protein